MQIYSPKLPGAHLSSLSHSFSEKRHLPRVFCNTEKAEVCGCWLHLPYNFVLSNKRNHVPDLGNRLVLKLRWQFRRWSIFQLSNYIYSSKYCNIYIKQVFDSIWNQVLQRIMYIRLEVELPALKSHYLQLFIALGFECQ